jgi:hypothetical protein
LKGLFLKTRDTGCLKREAIGGEILPQIFVGSFDEIKEQLEKSYIIPVNIPEKVYIDRLNYEAKIIYRALRVYKKYVKYPLEIIILKNRPTGRYCVYSTIDEHDDVIEKQCVYICPYNLICPFPGARVSFARIAEDIHSCYKSLTCRKQKGGEF